MKCLLVLSLFWYLIVYDCDSVPDYQRAAKISNYLKDVFPELYSKQHEGDIFLFGDRSEMKNAVRDVKYRWPNATIPYKLSSNFSEDDKIKIMSAMGRLQNETCIRFVPQNYQKNYIYIDNKEHGGCFAVIGYHTKADGPHPVNLETPGCLKHQGTIEHEFLHVIGLFHEQSRHDRDDHVTIYWGNITEEYKSNFAKVPESEATGYNVSYDITSVMHYPRYAFSKNGNETIVSKKNPEMKLGQRIGATQGDLDKVRHMYNCYKKEVTPYGSPVWFFEQWQKIFEDNNKQKQQKKFHQKQIERTNNNFVVAKNYV